MTEQPEHRHLPDDVDGHVCKPGARVYYCPTGGEIESDCHGGFDVCCARPDLHQPLLPCSSAHFQRQPHAPHSWEPQPGMNPVHCPGHSDPAAADRPTLADLDVTPEPARWCCSGNAEDCPLCDTAALPYPWICPGHPRTADNERIVRDRAEERAAAEAYDRVLRAPLSEEACAALRERLESGTAARRKVHREAATEPAGAVCTVTVTVGAPTPENAAQWAQAISDLVTAEYGQEMRLSIHVGQQREAP